MKKDRFAQLLAATLLALLTHAGIAADKPNVVLVDFMKRQKGVAKPFFAFAPYTQTPLAPRDRNS